MAKKGARGNPMPEGVETFSEWFRLLAGHGFSTAQIAIVTGKSEVVITQVISPLSSNNDIGAYLRAHAEIRGIQLTALKRMIFSAIGRDKIVDAVLDDDCELDSLIATGMRLDSALATALDNKQNLSAKNTEENS